MSKRKAAPGARYTYNDARFGPVELVADEDGVIECHGEAEEHVADRLRLPVNRPASRPKAPQED